MPAARKKKTLPALKKSCWDLLSQWVRRKDADAGGTVECYTCRGLFHWKDLHAGHFVPGRTGAVLLNEDVIRPQCVRCNIYLAGNYHAFTLRMIDDVGRSRVDELLALRHRVKKWSRVELETLQADLKARLAAL